MHRSIWQLGTLSSLLLAGCAHSRVVANAEGEVKPVVLVGVTESLNSTSREYSAILSPDAQTEESFRIPGYITSILQSKGPDGRWRSIEPGMTVSAGSVLATIRAADYQSIVDRAKGSHGESLAAISAARHQLLQAQAVARQAEQDFARVEILWAQESITKSLYDGSLARRDATRAAANAAAASVDAALQRAEAAGAQVREAQISLGDTALVAPYSGVVLERRVEKGALVSPGVPVFSIADMRRVKARFNVPDTELGTLAVGQPMQVQLAAFAGQSLTGHILSIARSADPKARSFEVQLTIDNPSGRLRSGMIATVSVPSPAAEPVLSIPVAALVHDPVTNRDHVFIARSNRGKQFAHLSPVQAIPGGGPQIAIVRGSLQRSDRVVTSGAMMLNDGDRIEEVRQ